LRHELGYASLEATQTHVSLAKKVQRQMMQDLALEFPLETGIRYIVKYLKSYFY
jgi:hypothetical protein